MVIRKHSANIQDIFPLFCFVLKDEGQILIMVTIRHFILSEKHCELCENVLRDFANNDTEFLYDYSINAILCFCVISLFPSFAPSIVQCACAALRIRILMESAGVRLGVMLVGCGTLCAMVDKSEWSVGESVRETQSGGVTSKTRDTIVAEESYVDSVSNAFNSKETGQS